MEPSKKVIHYIDSNLRPLCGDSGGEIHSTNQWGRVNCVDCRKMAPPKKKG